MAWKKVGSAAWKGDSKPARTAVKKVTKGKADLVAGSKQQEVIWKEFVKPNGSHIIVQALAGTGKTFTVIHGLRRLIDSGWGGRATFVAFNTAIAAELKTKVPLGVNASTCHSLLFRAYRDSFPRCRVDDDKTWKLLSFYVGGDDDIREMLRTEPALFTNVKKLVGLAKGTLLGYSEDDGEFDIDNVEDDEFLALAEKYGLELNGTADKVCEYVRQVLRVSADDEESEGLIDYDDMIWLPVILNLRLPVFDLLCVDEGQDLTRCQQEAILRMGSRIVLVGDPNQSIYGFRGADIQSMARMESSLDATKKGVKVMPLTVTRRCPKSHVKLAQTIVPKFEAMPNAIEGTITTMIEEKAVDSMKDGDLVICRVNAPIVSIAFRLLRMGRKANIQGRDLGQGLLSLIRKLIGRNEGDVEYLLDKLELYESRETQKIESKKNSSEAKLLALQDKCDCIRALCDNVETITEVRARIETLFMDLVAGGDKPRNFVLLSSVHRAKGLEADTVVIIYPEKMPHPMSKGAEGLQQEMNCKYVAFTRSKSELILVPEPKNKRS